MTKRLLSFSLLICLSVNNALVAQDNSARVYIMAGQSNMEGKGSVETLKHQLKDPEKSNLFSPLMDGDDFKIRDDVYISYLGSRGTRSGTLEIGYATSQKNDKRMFGPELGFGWSIGDHFEQPVIIIKTAWGGKSIDRDFRPPSRGFPDSIEQHLENRKKKNKDYTREQCQKEYGHFYRQMIDHVNSVLADEELKKKFGKMQLSGFVWFQGFNDQFAPTSVEDYQDNMVAFVKDVRKDLDTPGLKFVIGAMGHDGANQKGKVKLIADAQVATATHFDDGSVKTIRTAEFWDTTAHEAFQKYWADKPNRDIEKWKTFGNDRPYHYHGSPRFFWQVGQAFAKTMLTLESN